MNIVIHNHKHLWYRYLWPHRLTLQHNPPIYRWLWWAWGLKKMCEDCIHKDCRDHWMSKYLRQFDDIIYDGKGCPEYKRKPCKIWRPK